jgi:hypothetical protein
MARIYRSDQVSIHVTIRGVTLDTESWDMLEGGDNKAEEVTVFPGAMAEQVALGGIPKRSPITVERLWADSLIGAYKQIEGLVGKAEVEASYTVLGPAGESTGNTFNYTGVLTGCTRPNYKAGTSEEAKLSLEFSLNGSVT